MKETHNRQSRWTGRDPTGYNGLPDELADLVDEICDQFETCWRQGSSPVAEEFLDRIPIEARQVLLRELMMVEIPYRHRRGEQLSVEKICKRFPDVDRTWVTSAVVSTLDGTQAGNDTLLGPASLPSIDGYEILEEVGRGSMGIVYRAIQLGLGRIVAIKTLPTLSKSNRELVARFRCEAEAVAKLDHVGFVKVFDVDHQATVPYFSMEFIAGGSLGQLLKARPLPPRLAAEVVMQLAESIHYAHQQGIVHRDLKPENVLLAENADSTLRPKITDLGLAKQVDSTSNLTVDGALLGTPSYMAPEQTGLSDAPLTHACDIYGLGAILYSSLVGRPPFHAATIVDTIQLVRDAEPVSPREMVPNIPRDLETICLKCLEKTPHHRYESAMHLANDLRNFLDGEAIEARPPTIAQLINKELARSNRDFTQYHLWSKYFLAVAPIPPAIHLIFTILFPTWYYFPHLIILTTLVTFTIAQFVILALTKDSLRHLPSKLRRHALYVLNANLVAEAIALIAVWWNSDPQQPVQLLQVYPIWGILVGIVYFSLAFEFGIFHLIGAMAFLLAIPGVFFPYLGPLCIALTFLCNTVGQGILYRRLAFAMSSCDGSTEIGRSQVD